VLTFVLFGFGYKMSKAISNGELQIRDPSALTNFDEPLNSREYPNMASVKTRGYNSATGKPAMKSIHSGDKQHSAASRIDIITQRVITRPLRSTDKMR